MNKRITYSGKETRLERGIGGTRTDCTKIMRPRAKKNNVSEMLRKRINMVEAEAQEAGKSRTRSGNIMCGFGIET